MAQSYSAREIPLQFDGRIDTQHSSGPVLIWQASRVSFAFSGDRLELEFEVLFGMVGLRLEIAGRSERLSLRTVGVHTHRLDGLGDGVHEVVLTKTSEADAGWVALRRVGVEGKVLASAARAAALRFEFFGDSITAAACSEDGAVDQWDDRTLHDSLTSYAAFTAAAFGASHGNTSVSGMGICTGYVPQRAGEIWDRLYPRAESPRAELSRVVPQLVCVNWGENDHAHSSEFNYPFPEDFAAKYVEVVGRIRATYPTAPLVLLRGGMAGGATGEGLRKAWEAARQTLQAADPTVHAFVFSHWTELHPRKADHRRMADELVAWLRAQPFLKQP
ncbi:GDSL-type esterase/lipase family protein [Nibricoccus sp. IMCC34717]|uniref:GDSL-type esterase/lipase family protein n=1 Tax=Nibricoccus sp. IMCC34717 TaxID=3034021 RepID=UPI00384F2EAD